MTGGNEPAHQSKMCRRNELIFRLMFNGNKNTLSRLTRGNLQCLMRDSAPFWPSKEIGMIDNSLSMTLQMAVELGLAKVADSARVAPSVRFVPYEDTGESSGMSIIGAGSILRDGVIVCSGVEVGEETMIGCHVVLRARVRVGSQS